MNHTPATTTENDVLDQLMTGEQSGFSPESAQAILSIHFSPTAINRINELAEKNRQGILSDAERADLERYLRVGNFLNVVQAKARVRLAAAPRTGS